MIFLVPLEQFEQRYTGQWYKWFLQEFDHPLRMINYQVIEGTPLRSVIKNGSFLDVVSTNHFKSTQIQQLCKLLDDGLIHDNDTIFFMDLWHPGIESLFYIRNGLKLKFKITGCLHAGSYDPHDFLNKTGMTSWAEDLEKSWFNEVDKIFVATQYHKNLLINSRRVDWRKNDKVIITGFPIYPSAEAFLLPEYENVNIEKKNIVVFPHRLDEEKRPEVFDWLINEITNDPKLSHWDFIRSFPIFQEQGKKAYYELLAESKIAVSFAMQETWGIAMQECLFLGNCLFVPDKLSYEEMYPNCFKYNSTAANHQILSWFKSMLSAIDQDQNFYKFAMEETIKKLRYAGEMAIPNMLKEMGE